MHNKISDFVIGLDAHKTSDEVWDAACRFFNSEGFSLVSHGYLPKETGADANMAAKSMRVASKEAVLDFYFHHGFQHDPIFHKPVGSFDPYFTGPDFTERDLHEDEYFEVMKEVRSLSLRTGLVVPLLDAQAGDFGRTLLGSALEGKEFTALIGEHGAMYNLAVLLMNQRLRALPSKAEIDSLKLTAKEIECLLWLSNGMRVDRIAEKMGISNATVNFHFSNAKKKLHAVTREQALAKSIYLGIIQP